MPYHSIDVHDLDKAQTIAVRVRITGGPSSVGEFNH